MKTIPVSFLVVSLLLPAIGQAQPSDAPKGPAGEGKGGHRPPSQRPYVDAWKKADLDQDGFLSRTEFDAMPRILSLPEEQRGKIFDRLDKDADGKLSREELGRFGGKPRDGDGPPMKRLWELDTDNSGGVDLEEFKKGQLFKKLPPEKLEELFRRLDTDQDGVITPKDQPQPPFKRQGGDKSPGKEHISRKLDVNGDGALSFEEFRAGNPVKNLTEDEQEDRFELLDRNGDHKISEEDFAKPVDSKPEPEGKPSH